MQTRHVAYGLDLRCSFALAGMRPATAEGLPRLALELVTPTELDDAWSGHQGPPDWTGRLGDGCSLTIEHGVGGDVLFGYDDRARFRLDASREHLDCAPSHEGLHWQQVLLGRVLPNVGILRGYEALHASAVEAPAGAVAIAAPSGMGKTTLALELVRRGWPLFADDVLMLGDGPEGVRAHPGTPHMNVAVGPADAPTTEARAGALPPPETPTTEAHTGELPPSETPTTEAHTGELSYTEEQGSPIDSTLGVLAGERWVTLRADAAASKARPVRLLCMLERGPGLPLEGRVLPSSPLPLAPYMLGLTGDAQRERQRFSRYADLMSAATLMQLSCETTDRPGDLADLIEQTLEGRSALAVGAAR